MYLFSDHPELLEVDQTVELGVVGQVDEGEIFLHDRVERDDWGLDLVPVQEVPVAAHVPARVHQLLHLVEQALVLGRKFLPRKTKLLRLIT